MRLLGSTAPHLTFVAQCAPTGQQDRAGTIAHGTRGAIERRAGRERAEGPGPPAGVTGNVTSDWLDAPQVVFWPPREGAVTSTVYTLPDSDYADYLVWAGQLSSVHTTTVLPAPAIGDGSVKFEVDHVTGDSAPYDLFRLLWRIGPVSFSLWYTLPPGGDAQSRLLALERVVEARARGAIGQPAV